MKRTINIVPTSPGVPWKCLNCGECCGRISISRREYNLILDRIPPKAKKIFEKAIKVHPKNPKYRLIEGKCPFYHKKTKKCLIYKIRPFACRLFICGRSSMNEKLIFQGGKCINHNIRLTKDPYFRDQAARSVQEAKEWGAKYGWPSNKSKL